MNQGQKTYTIGRIKEISRLKRYELDHQTRKDITALQEQDWPLRWSAIPEKTKLKKLRAAIRSKKIKPPSTKKLLDHFFRNISVGSRAIDLDVMFDGLDEFMNEINSENVNAKKESYEKIEGMKERDKKRKSIILAEEASLCDQIMLGEDADKAIAAIKVFEAKSF